MGVWWARRTSGCPSSLPTGGVPETLSYITAGGRGPVRVEGVRAARGADTL